VETDFDELLMEMAEANLLDQTEGCEIKKDVAGTYIEVTAIKPEEFHISDYKGVRVKAVPLPVDLGYVQSKSEIKALSIARGELPSEEPYANVPES
jgi:hypothetical protein